MPRRTAAHGLEAHATKDGHVLPRFSMTFLWAAVGAMLLLSGCVLAPKETKDEQHRLELAGKAYEPEIDRRAIAPLPAAPSWPDVLQRAFLTNGDIEAAYFDWKAAMARVQQAGAYPNTNVSLNFSYLFSKERMKSWDRTTLGAGFDPAMPLQWPGKVEQAARVALDDALGKGKRFEAAKFALQQKVLVGWYDLALLCEKIRIQQENVDLLNMLVETATQRVRAGAPQQDLLKAQTEHELARNELANLQNELKMSRAMLNGMIGRPAGEPLDPPAELPPARTIPVDDARLLAVAVDNNPELAALAHDVQGKTDALELARMQYIPDISPQFSITGNIEKMLGTMVTLPSNLPRIKGAIEESRAMLRSTQAMARQVRSERGASFVATLYSLRNNERQIALFNDSVLPRARQVLAASHKAYASGNIGFADLIDSQRTLLEVRSLIAEARMSREKRLVELETLAGVDVEALSRPTTQPALDSQK
ncbi:MAG: TolC family protein [Tepidisphaerales bacterium]